MTPHSPGTDQIDTLLWIGFVAAAIVVVAINVALIYALRRYRSERGAEPRQVISGRRVQFRVGALLTVFAAAILVLSLIYTDKAREIPASGAAGLQVAHSEPLQIEATGQQWLWRYDYRRPQDDPEKPAYTFSYYKLIVPVDTTVELDLISTDVIHTWDVPDLAGKHDAVPGKRNHVVFRADEEGNFYGQSATLSGQAYAPMRTEVEVVSPERYEAFLEQQHEEVQAAQTHVVDQIEHGEVP